ncbi:MAG: hypothetical protein ACXU9G_06275 [Syntrophales bacterium]
MNTKVLKSAETDLLREVLLKLRPPLLTMIDSIGIVPLTDNQREELRSVVADELVETGLGKDDEPNERGLLLEHLIDRVGHL